MPDLRKRLQRTLAGLDAPGLVEPAAADITVVGLGPGDPGHLTRAAGAALAGARVVWLRTTGHPGAASIPAGIPVHSCDDLYVAHATFDAVYHAIAARLVDAARDGPVVYAVPGDPGVGETSVRYLLRAAGQHDLSVQVLPGVSFLEPTLAAIGWDAFDGLQIVDATAIGEQHHPQLDPGLPAIVGQVYSRLVASDLKLTLLNQYPPEHAVTLITGAGAGPAPGTLQADDAPVGLRVLTLPLHELDHHEIFDDLTSLAIPPVGRGRGPPARPGWLPVGPGPNP
jgi:tetrapyrrole methylase family protein/MazG family protein